MVIRAQIYILSVYSIDDYSMVSMYLRDVYYYWSDIIYFSHIAIWKLEITIMSKQSVNTRSRTPDSLIYKPVD